ncbi:uncharacterized protein LOC135350605 isoform X2 [Halichondria panicea]|uniref:uncharacterized protein LOC135350605 isoform X2 n=1 Tax=Halichondria panicea TaxID=6063 RepID=UPI00312B976E
MEVFECASYRRYRTRATSLSYEQAKDHLSVWLGSTHTQPVCALLQALVIRCSLHHLSYLWTALEGVGHRDLLSMLHRSPLSTPASREVSSRLARSTIPQNKMLYRATSTAINTTPQLQLNPPPRPCTRLSRPLSSPHTPTQLITHNTSRVQTPARRHMDFDPPLCLRRTIPSDMETLPSQVLHFVTWFRELPQDWQAQEVLQLVVSSLDSQELYTLATLLMSRQFRDFVAHLPEELVIKVMTYVPAKDILRSCCLVSNAWRLVCSTECVWKVKVCQRSMGLPLTNCISWKDLYLNDLRLRKNWARGVCTSRALEHSSKMLCVQLRDDYLVAGGTDKSVRLWKVSTGECISKWMGHSRSVWSVCFYGKSFVISGSGDHTIKIWNTRTGVCERSLHGHSGSVWALKQRGELLISGAHDKTAVLWDIRGCVLSKRLLGHGGGVFGVELDSNGHTAFTASGDKSIRQWCVKSGECVRVTAHTGSAPVLSLHWDKGYLVSGCGSVVTLWTGATLERLGEFKGHCERVECVQLRVSGPKVGTILSGGQDGVIKYWDIKSGRCIRTLTGGNGKLSSLVWDEVHVISAHQSSSIKLWDFHPTQH